MQGTAPPPVHEARHRVRAHAAFCNNSLADKNFRFGRTEVNAESIWVYTTPSE